jgi:hypothetical protein
MISNPLRESVPNCPHDRAERLLAARRHRLSEFFAANAIVSAAAVIAFLIFESGRLSSPWWLPVAALPVWWRLGGPAAAPLLARGPGTKSRSGGIERLTFGQ